LNLKGGERNETAGKGSQTKRDTGILQNVSRIRKSEGSPRFRQAKTCGPLLRCKDETSHPVRRKVPSRRARSAAQSLKLVAQIEKEKESKNTIIHPCLSPRREATGKKREREIALESPKLKS